VIAHDVPFFGLARTLPPAMVADLVVVAHSTAGVHCPTEVGRVVWERRGLGRVAALGGRVAAISDHMRRHLVDDYDLPSAALIDLRIGLRPADWKRQPPADQALPGAARDGFWFAMGRAVPYKGFDDLLDALAILRDTGLDPVHLVLAAVTDSGGPTEYQRHLADRIAAEQLDVTLITRYADEIPDLLAHPALRAIVVPSRAEPFGRIPLEAYAAGATPVISTTAGGLPSKSSMATPGSPPHQATPPLLQAPFGVRSSRLRAIAQPCGRGEPSWRPGTTPVARPPTCLPNSALGPSRFGGIPRSDQRRGPSSRISLGQLAESRIEHAFVKCLNLSVTSSTMGNPHNLRTEGQSMTITQVRGYTDKNGRRVRSHPRRRPTAQAGAGAVGLAVLTVAVLYGLGGGAASTSSAVVIGIVDGDTIRVSDPGGANLGRVRLLGIDAPELGACHGMAAAQRLRRLLDKGSTVTLVTDPSQPERDRYGRLLRYVRLPSSQDAGEHMVAAGSARATSEPSMTNHRAYRNAERGAKRSAAGVWDC
jgi:endonuclease YncB( thermonuclease family)